jgi:hypothetical protein
MNAASDRYGAQIGGGYWLPGWAVRRLHADPRSTLNRYRRDLRGRDAELYRVMTTLSRRSPVRNRTNRSAEIGHCRTLEPASAHHRPGGGRTEHNATASGAAY